MIGFGQMFLGGIVLVSFWQLIVVSKLHMTRDRKVNGQFFLRLQDPLAERSCNPKQVMADEGVCEVWDWAEILVKESPEEYFITTFFDERYEKRPVKRSAQASKGEKVWINAGEDRKVYIATPEELVIILEHEIYTTSKFNREFAVGSQSIPGRLLNKPRTGNIWNSLIRDNPPVKIGFTKDSEDKDKRDRMQVKDILSAAGTSLDAIPEVTKRLELDKAIINYRRIGINLDFSVLYSNLFNRWFFAGRTEYEYSVSASEKDEGVRLFDIKVIGERSDDPGYIYRRKRRKFGIRIRLRQEAAIGKISLVSILYPIFTLLILGFLLYALLRLAH